MRVLVAGVLKPEKYGQAIQAIENFEVLHGEVSGFVALHDSWQSIATQMNPSGYYYVFYFKLPDKNQWGHRAQEFAIAEAFEMEIGYALAFPSTPTAVLKEAKQRKIPILDLRKMLK